jgi:hypothetical protein
VNRQKSYIVYSQEAGDGKGAYSAEKRIPPLAEVILMYFAVASPVSRSSDDGSVFSSVNLVAAGERGSVAILA